MNHHLVLETPADAAVALTPLYNPRDSAPSDDSDGSVVDDPVVDDPVVDGPVVDAPKCASAIGGIRPFVAGCAAATTLIQDAVLAAMEKRLPKDRYTSVNLYWNWVVKILLEDGQTKTIPLSDLVWGPRCHKNNITKRDTSIWNRCGIPNPFRTVQAAVLRDHGLYLVDQSDTDKSNRTVVRLYAQLPDTPRLWHKLDRVPGVTKRVPRVDDKAIFPPPPQEAARVPVGCTVAPVQPPPGFVQMVCPDGIVRLMMLPPAGYPPAGYPPVGFPQVGYPPAGLPQVAHSQFGQQGAKRIR